MNVDDKYAMQLAVVACSILANLRPCYKLHLYVVAGGISRRNNRKILKSLKLFNFELVWVQIPKRIERELRSLRLLPGSHLSRIAYARLFLGELLPLTMQKVIYLDGDVIVQADLSKLWEEHLDKTVALLAVQDQGTLSIGDGLPSWREERFSPLRKYFNSGVMVIDLEKWRARDLYGIALAYQQKHKSVMRLHDQEILNFIFYDEWRCLDRRWNFAAMHNAPALGEQAYIIHFCWTQKPWNVCGHPYNSFFCKYLDLTEWRSAKWHFFFQKAFSTFRLVKAKIVRNLRSLERERNSREKPLTVLKLFFHALFKKLKKNF